MTGVLAWLVTAGGAVVVLVALRDIFHTIWHPTGRGGLGRRLMGAVWRVGRRALGPLTGPLAMVVVVLAWVLLILLGWALVYWPHLPGGFVFGSSLDPASRAGLLDAVYLSTVTLATLGFGDIVPSAGWLRIAVPVQALIGFALITAAVSWVLQVYPALQPSGRPLGMAQSSLHLARRRRRGGVRATQRRAANATAASPARWQHRSRGPATTALSRISRSPSMCSPPPRPAGRPRRGRRAGAPGAGRAGRAPRPRRRGTARCRPGSAVRNGCARPTS